MAEIEFNKDAIRLIMDKIDGSVENVAKATALKSWTSLVYKTPVGNPDLWKSKPPKGYVGGRAKFSWNLNFGNIDYKQPDNWSASGLPATPSVSVTFNYQPIFVTSSVPYMDRLEEGHSKQGSHMVKRTANEIKLEMLTL